MSRSSEPPQPPSLSSMHVPPQQPPFQQPRLPSPFALMLPVSSQTGVPQSSQRIVRRSVFAYNLESEIEIIALQMNRYSLISIHTDSLGNEYMAPRHSTPIEFYHFITMNVNSSKFLRLGLTMADFNGNLPNLGTNDHAYIWEFYFSGSFSESDFYVSGSTRSKVHDESRFHLNREYGIDPLRFRELAISFRLVLNPSVTWIVFSGASNFGNLIRCLSQALMPQDIREFLNLVNHFFGSFLDLRCVMASRNMTGNLDTLGNNLGVTRFSVGQSTHAGSQSLLIMDVFLEFRDRYFANYGVLMRYANVLSKLEV